MRRIDGPTPAGGTYSLAWGYDRAGLETDDLNDAVMVLIEEFDDRGLLVQRTRSGQFSDGPLDVNPSQAMGDSAFETTDPWNSEQGKGTWDVRRHRDQEPVTTLAELFEALQWDELPAEEQRLNLGNLMTMPSFAAAPESLKAEAYAEFAAQSGA